MEKKFGLGLVMAGTAKASLPTGKHTVKITDAKGENDGLFVLDTDGNPVLKDGKPVPAASENLNVELEYPDGFTKGHQVKNEADLISRITNQLRNHYGVKGDINILSTPKAIVAGSAVQLEIK